MARKDTRARLARHVGWPDPGAIRRRLDGVERTEDRKPWSLYEQPGDDAARGQRKPAVFKARVGHGP